MIFSGQNLQQTAVVMEKSHPSVMHVRSLGEEPVHVSSEEERRLLHRYSAGHVTHHVTESSEHAGKQAPPMIRMEHLMTALRETRPSVSQKERLRLNQSVSQNAQNSQETERIRSI